MRKKNLLKKKGERKGTPYRKRRRGEKEHPTENEGGEKKEPTENEREKKLIEKDGEKNLLI